MPAYSQSTIQSRSPVSMKFAASRSLWQGVGAYRPRRRSILSAVAFAEVYRPAGTTPCAAAVAAYISTTRKASKRPGIGGPEWSCRSSTAACGTVTCPPSPSTKRVTR